MRTKLEAAGGKVLDEVQLSSVDVYSDGVALTISGQTAAGGAHVDAAGAAAAGGVLSTGPRVQYSSTVTTRLLLDCMGHASPVVKQLRCVGAGDIGRVSVRMQVKDCFCPAACSPLVQCTFFVCTAPSEAPS
jgi:hypothetical protein